MKKHHIDNFNVVSLSHRLMEERIRPGNIIVDATCGNGHDTVFLAEKVTKKGHVYAFDIQPQANQAKKRV